MLNFFAVRSALYVQRKFTDTKAYTYIHTDT